MAIFRSFSEIVNSIIERLRLTQPNLDTKPGTVARDLFIDIQADQLQRLHSSILLVSEKQSPDSATGRDIDRWANNFGIIRRSGTPSNGIVVFTTNNIASDIPIPSGTIVTARNGLQFATIGSYVLSSSEKSRFLANANRLRSSLNLAGITDSYAIEVPVRALRSGTAGNISTYQVIESNLEDALNVINLSSFSGGTNNESDAAFKSRVFSVFSGSNTGTAFGYRNAALSVNGVNDAIVIEPGNTLMLRDGTETIQVNDGSFRILDSGTGGKVDLYILGKQLEEITESYVFIDKSGTGNASDERNDFILGQNNLDTTLTSEERRVLAFNSGILPNQPADSIVSVVGSRSGVLSQKTTLPDGTVSGNYELIKDTNVDTGGSPFGFDKIRFISGIKNVDAESIIKQSINSVDALRFSGSTNIDSVYQDISITNENSSVSSSDKTVVKLNHSPVVTVSRVRNITTGEVYVVESQNIDSETGLNNTGEVIISGRTLPSRADILSVDYVWRLIFDKYIDYNGEYTGFQLQDPGVSDSIDWGTSNGIRGEVSIIERTADGLEYQLATAHDVSRVISVYSADTAIGSVGVVESIGGAQVPGVTIGSEFPAIENIISVKDDRGVELYSTIRSDGSYSGRTIILPSDYPGTSSNSLTVFYNKKELYNISDGDGAFSNNIITLPSEDILEGNQILSDVNSLYLSEDDVYVDYVAEINEISPSISLSLLPINGSSISNSLLSGNLSILEGSNQPVFYTFNSDNEISGIERFGPTRLSVTMSGTSRSGKIRVTGETLIRADLDIIAGVSISGKRVDLGPYIREWLSLNTIPGNIGIARVDRMFSLDDDSKEVELIGHSLSKNKFGYGVVNLDTSLNSTSFLIPSTLNNNNISFSPGEMVRLSILIYNSADSEDLYFSLDSKVITDKIFARIDRISVSSGFRSPSGTLIGSILVEPTSQPGVGFSYLSNYSFKAPIEGERITVRYNLNRLISDVTVNLESVRSVTADVLVKESPTLSVDVYGEIIINKDFSSEENTIIQNASNAVVNLLNSSTLGSTIDYSDVINSVTSVTGVDSVNISLFNESGRLGRKSYIKALDNQSIVAGEVIFTSISRQDFRIT